MRIAVVSGTSFGLFHEICGTASRLVKDMYEKFESTDTKRIAAIMPSGTLAK